MIDLIPLHKKIDCAKPLHNFLRSKTYTETSAALFNTGIPKDEIDHYTPATRGQPSQRKVHPVLALEYLRWADQRLYVRKVTKMMEADRGGEARAE